MREKKGEESMGIGDICENPWGSLKSHIRVALGRSWLWRPLCGTEDGASEGEGTPSLGLVGHPEWEAAVKTLFLLGECQGMWVCPSCPLLSGQDSFQ